MIEGRCAESCLVTKRTPLAGKKWPVGAILCSEQIRGAHLRQRTLTRDQERMCLQPLYTEQTREFRSISMFAAEDDGDGYGQLPWRRIEWGAGANGLQRACIKLWLAAAHTDFQGVRPDLAIRQYGE